MPMRKSEEKDHDHRVWCRRNREERDQIGGAHHF